MKLFDTNIDIKILLEENIPEAIYLAAFDLQDNLRKLSGKKDGFDIVRNGENKSVVKVKTLGSGDAESYEIHVMKDGVLIEGSDTLGTVFGIYAFATKCLGILPVYRLVDLFPEVREKREIEETTILSPERKVRFRGWFLNDEDLLTEWKISGGKRRIDYPFYGDVMDPAVLDLILETALRMEINLMIPSSFVDIDNPAEEELVKAVCRRGMYISQHHVEPVGVSYFGADNYMKDRGYENEPVSFVQNRARMEEIWRYYIEKWAKYGDRVVWQLGLRGKADQAIWKADPSVPVSMEARGDIITDAITTQYNIIRNTLGTDSFHSTATLWNEGSELYSKGFLKLPEGTITIFSDFGIDQMFGDDFYTVSRRPDRKYGIYYHTGFWSLGPHLTEGNNPEKMAYCYREAAEHNNLYYSILNISNVRPFHLSAMINSRILQKPLDFNTEAELLKLDQELFGAFADKVGKLRCEYYKAFTDLGDDPLKEAAENWGFYYREYGELPFIRNAATDGQLARMGRNAMRKKHQPGLPNPDRKLRKIAQESSERFLSLYRKAEELEAILPEKTRLYFKQFLKYQIRHMHLISEFCVACIDIADETLPTDERIKQCDLACVSLNGILEERKILEIGAWENWHRGEKKINIQSLLKETIQKCNELKEQI